MVQKAYISKFWENCHPMWEEHKKEMKLNYHGDYICVEPGCTNGISIFDYEKVLDKLMQTIIEDDAEDIICNYTGRKFKTGKLKFTVEKQDGDVFWVSIPERR